MNWIERFRPDLPEAVRGTSDDIAAAVLWLLQRDAALPPGRETEHTRAARVLREYWKAAREREAAEKRSGKR